MEVLVLLVLRDQLAQLVLTEALEPLVSMEVLVLLA
jgi:hypothetical protein